MTDPEAPSSGGMGPAFILSVWQQWWKLALPSGIALAVLACLIVLACFVPKYEATVFMLIGRDPSPVGRDGQSQSDDGGWVGTQVQIMLSPVVLTPVLSREGVAEIKELAEQNDPVAWIGQNLTVESRKNSGLYEVRFVGRDPRDCATLVNAVVKTYVDKQGENEQQYQKEVVKRLNDAMTARLVVVGELQQSLRDLSKGLSPAEALAGNPRPAATGAEGTLAGLRQQLALAEVEYEQVTAELRAAEAMQQKPRTQQSIAVIALEVDVTPEMISAKKEIADIKAGLAELEARAKQGATSSSYVQGKRKLAVAESKADEIRKQLTGEITKRLDLTQRIRLEERIDALKQRQASADAAIKLLTTRCDEEVKKLHVAGADTGELELVRAELAREEKVLDLIGSSKLFLETGLKSRPNISIEKFAEPPTQPIEAHPTKFLAAAGLAGALFPFGLAIFWERLVRRVNDAEQLSQDASLDVIGEIVELPSRPVLMRGQAGHRRLMRDVGIYQECIDNLRTCLHLAELSKHTKVIAVTSATSGEGKTSLVSQLGISIARATGARVLLIDGDMRSPELHEILKVRLSPGLAEVLEGTVGLDEAIVPGILDQYDQLSMLPAGRLTCSPHQLMGGAAFERLLGQVRGRYDYVVVDTPPVLCASESLVIAKSVDGALLCALYEVSRSRQVRLASDRMSRAGARVLGAVFAGTPLGRYSLRYGQYGYGSPYLATSASFAPYGRHHLQSSAISRPQAPAGRKN